MKNFAINTLGFKVNTPHGFMHFDGIAYKGEQRIYRLTFGNKKYLDITSDHKLLTPDGFKETKNLNVGEWVYQKNDKKTKIKSIVDTGKVEPVYDLINVDGDNTYYTNSILSHNCEFVTDDETLINPLTLSRLKHSDPEFYTGTIRWYKDIEPNMTYLVALDPSGGTGRDYSAIEVFEIDKSGHLSQIAEWQHNTSTTKQQITMLMKILVFIDQTLQSFSEQSGHSSIFWTIENNSIGEAGLVIIEDTGEDRFPGIMISEKKKKGQTRRVRKGLNTDNRKKLTACLRMKSLIESDRMIIKSNELLKQLKTFVSRENSYGAKPGTHDDLVMASYLIVRMLETVLGWQAPNTSVLREKINEEDITDEDYGVMPTIV